jgi:predicted GNAT family acetyltransferase
VRATLAADYACQPEDLTSGEVTIVEAREVSGRRRFPFRANFFALLTMGHGVVVACGADRLAWAEANLRQSPPERLFEVSTLAMISNYVVQAGQRLGGPYLQYVCSSDTFRAAPVPTGFRLELFEQEQIQEAYAFTGFHHALSYRLENSRPDVIAVAAWHKQQVIGMAGVSADNDQLWQIGVNVDPTYWGMGIGKALVSRATEAILEHDKTPYYATRITNIASGNTARSVGYQLAWTDAYVRDL